MKKISLTVIKEVKIKTLVRCYFKLSNYQNNTNSDKTMMKHKLHTLLMEVCIIYPKAIWQYSVKGLKSVCSFWPNNFKPELS